MSAWQGVPAPGYPEGATLDLLLNAWLGKFTGGISPAALGNAYADWLSHLALAPSKQQTLHRHDAPYIDADSWQRDVPQHDGSWWPAWQAWLAQRPGTQVAPPAMGPDLGDAPGSYVLQA